MTQSKCQTQSNSQRVFMGLGGEKQIYSTAYLDEQMLKNSQDIFEKEENKNKCDIMQ